MDMLPELTDAIGVVSAGSSPQRGALLKQIYTFLTVNGLSTSIKILRQSQND